MKRILSYAWNNFIRNGFVSLATILVISIIIFIFNITILISNVSEAVLSEINKKVDLIVEVKEGADEVLLQSLVKDLGRMEEVEKVEFISKEKAFENFKSNHPEKAEFLEKYKLNPLPPQIQITTKNPIFHEKIISFLGEKRFRDVVSTDKLKRKVVFFAFLKSETNTEEVIEDIKESEDVLEVEKIPESDKEKIISEAFGEKGNLAEELFIQEEEMSDLNILKIESEYPGKNLKAKDFLLSTFFKNKILLLKELEEKEATKSKNITEKVSEWIISFGNSMRSVKIWFFTGMLICGIIIVVNAIHLSISMRKEEIEIMKLVGAKFSSIRAPFLAEGAIYGLFSAFLSIIAFALILGLIDTDKSYDIFFLSKESFKEAIFLGDFVIWELLMSVGLGILASSLAIFRYLDFSRKK